ncbi:hypothetical protein [Actinopolymorpha rutila]|uniref:Membrane protein implicated in regulation of membrane protease activity n=1 Tax=Actinopolymorpha rutila TaxID=446787 RepID=A0A852ZKD0_9ACTN|nr:hypothetical protein [Actinopolymorpha rutila]NYH93444.1 membrane protein implicated in regulation of membrane protease activity [Actinopolymorpha rutila]
MVNNVATGRDEAAVASALIGIYAVLALGTVAALVVLSEETPARATQEAWGHAVIVAVFAVVLSLRWRAARRGSSSALRAVQIIAGVLLAVNLVEACLSFFPGWMRVEMVVIAAVMLAVTVLLARHVRRTP